jgi:hypothetical protein
MSPTEQADPAFAKDYKFLCRWVNWLTVFVAFDTMAVISLGFRLSH